MKTINYKTICNILEMLEEHDESFHGKSLKIEVGNSEGYVYLSNEINYQEYFDICDDMDGLVNYESAGVIEEACKGVYLMFLSVRGLIQFLPNTDNSLRKIFKDRQVFKTTKLNVSIIDTKDLIKLFTNIKELK